MSFIVYLLGNFAIAAICTSVLTLRHHADKRKALRELAAALNEYNQYTQELLWALQQKIATANYLQEVRDYMEAEYLRKMKEIGIEPVLRLDWARTRREERNP